MATSMHVIELNGQLYDAVTGRRVGQDEVPLDQPETPVVHQRVRQAAAALSQSAASISAPARQTASQASTVDSVSRPKQAAATHPVKPAAHAHRRAQHSQTLMRTTVKKPATIKPLKRAVPSPKAAAAKSTLVRSPSHDTFVKPERVIRSMHVVKSAQISRFGTAAAVKATAIPVASAPPVGRHHQIPAVHVRPLATINATGKPAQPAADLFTDALNHADSHNQPKPQRASRLHRTAAKIHIRPRTLAIGGSALVLLLVTGFLIQQNAPYVAMKVASSRSGVDASLPRYQPTGYSMERPIDYTAGQVSVTYKSNSDDRDYKLVQRASSWNSDALLENVIGAREHQVYQASGRTIYIYDNNTATWVDGGIWYKIEGNANLSSDQLRKIVDSL